MSAARRSDVAMGTVALLVILLDQLTKHWIFAYFTTGEPKQPVSILGQVLQLDYTHNTGVAFSLLTGNAALFLFIALALGVIGTLYWRFRDTGHLLLKLSFGLILGGAAGNLIDRAFRGYVVDFVHFQLPSIHFDFAVFNLADSAICVGVALLAFLLWRGDTQEEKSAVQPGPATDIVPRSAASAPPTSPRVRRRVESSR
jgi:signal peptidase II